MYNKKIFKLLFYALPFFCMNAVDASHRDRQYYREALPLLYPEYYAIGYNPAARQAHEVDIQNLPEEAIAIPAPADDPVLNNPPAQPMPRMSLQERLNSDRPEVFPFAFPHHIFYRLGLNITEEILKPLLNKFNNKLRFTTALVEFKEGIHFNTELRNCYQQNPIAQSPIADTVIAWQSLHSMYADSRPEK